MFTGPEQQHRALAVDQEPETTTFQQGMMTCLRGTELQVAAVRDWAER